jgi:hypothetical protein
LSKSCQKVAKKLPKSCQSCHSCLESGVNGKLLTVCYFSIKSGVCGRAKSGSKAFGDYFVVSRRQKEKSLRFYQVRQVCTWSWNYTRVPGRPKRRCQNIYCTKPPFLIGYLSKRNISTKRTRQSFFTGMIGILRWALSSMESQRYQCYVVHIPRTYQP